MMNLWIWFQQQHCIGHCNTMGTASSMNSVAEALRMFRWIAIPVLTEREQISFDTGKNCWDGMKILSHLIMTVKL